MLQSSPWAGARVDIGAAPPATPKPGELWFDICELTEPDIGFRTAIAAQTGLYQRVTAWHIFVEDVRFSSLLDRSRFRAVRHPDEPLKELFAYTFRSEIGIRQMHARLTDLGTWKWHERDNDRWGEYISASPLPTARRAQIKILDAPDAPDRFAVNVHLESDDADARAQFDEVRRVLVQDVLPAIGARELVETDTYE